MVVAAYAAALGGAGVVIGKIAADVLFYVPVVITSELRRQPASQRPLSWRTATATAAGAIVMLGGCAG